MIFSEFQTWTEDASKRWPDAAIFLEGLPVDVEEMWFRDVFARMQLRDCLEANAVIMRTQEIDKWEVPKLPAKVSKIVQEYVDARRQASHRAAERQMMRSMSRERGGDIGSHLVARMDDVCKGAFRAVLEGHHQAKMAFWKSEGLDETAAEKRARDRGHGLSDEEVREVVEGYFDEHDKSDCNPNQESYEPSFAEFNA